MFHGAHVVLYTADPAADRAFFRDVLEFPFVDAGHDWLIFKLPPAEVALHPLDSAAAGGPGHAMLGAELYLMCDDLEATIERLKSKRVTCTAIDKAPWGVKTRIGLPSGGEIGLYQPSHPTALDLG